MDELEASELWVFSFLFSLSSFLENPSSFLQIESFGLYLLHHFFLGGGS